jgi:Arc/MetJ family transcription regulator
MMIDAHEELIMRTTLAIDDDVLTAARAIARQSKRTVGEVVSDLARSALRPPSPQRTRNGILLLPLRGVGVIVTPEIVSALRDESP